MSTGYQLCLLLLSLLLLTAIKAECPGSLGSVCKCSSGSPGLAVICTYADLNELSGALQGLKSTIDRLEVLFTPLTSLTAESFGGATIRSLTMAGNNMTKLNIEALANLRSSLEYLAVVNNSLSNIPSLNGFSRLQTVDFSGNLISEVPEGIFADLNALENVRLARNRICTLGRNSFNETRTNLALLDMSQNCLTKVPAQNIRGFPKLTTVDFSFNDIVDLQNLQFTNLPNLVEVRLQSNKIAQVWPLAFMNVPRLQHLYLQDNQISVIEANKFQSLEALEVLNMSRNAIPKIPTSSFQNLPALKNVFLDDNLIEIVETLAFSNNPKLQIISMQNNKITQLSRNAFDQLPATVILLLSGNKLTSVDSGILSGLPSLQQLNLRSNQISNFSSDTFDAVTQLTTLDLGRNQIVNLPSRTFFKLTKLFWLDLSDNQLKTVQKGSLPPHVANLLLDGNQFQCDSDLDWLVEYLVKGKVRTFLPGQKEILCTGPSDVAGKRIKDMMISKANDTFFKDLLGQGGSAGGLPLSSLMNLPGFGALSSLTGTSGSDPTALLDSFAPGLSKLTTPLVNLAESGNDTNALSRNVNSLLTSLPSVVAGLGPSAIGAAGTIPGFPGLDISQIPPGVIQHVLNGGQIPGVPPSVLSALVQQYSRGNSVAVTVTPVPIELPAYTYAYGAIAGSATVTPAQFLSKFTSTGFSVATLPPLAEVPKEIIQLVVSGGKIPGLTDAQMAEIRSHYAAQYLTTLGQPVKGGKVPLITGAPSTGLPNIAIAGLDLTQVPPDVLKDIAAGRTPDVSKIPVSILQSLQANPYLLVQLQKSLKTGPVDAHGIPLPPPSDAPRPITPPPYDINALSPDGNAAHIPGAGVITAIVLATVGFLTLLTVAFLCYQRHLRRRAEQIDRAKFFAAPISATDTILPQQEQMSRQWDRRSQMASSIGHQPKMSV